MVTIWGCHYGGWHFGGGTKGNGDNMGDGGTMGGGILGGGVALLLWCPLLSTPPFFQANVTTAFGMLDPK